MAFQPSLDADVIDERGHTKEQAKLQHPTLDLDAKPASEETPTGSDTLVPAQSDAEVRAQIENRAGAEGDTHDLSEQLVEAARRQSEDAEDGAADGEAAEIAEANEELGATGADDDDADDDEMALEDEDEDEDA